MNPNITFARPEDDAYNIQRRRPTSSNSTKNPCSTSSSLMDNSSPPSEVDYAECVTANCNIDIEITDLSLSLVKNATCFSFSLLVSNPCVPLKEVPNSINISDTNISTELSPLEVIPYSANVPADPSLWNGNFMATSLFGTNEFLNSDINNITCSLQHMSWLGKLAKSLFIFLFFSFLFLFTTTRWSMGKYHMTLSQCHNGVTEVSQMVMSQVTVTRCHMTRVTWGPWESKCIATVVKYISSRRNERELHWVLFVKLWTKRQLA